MVEGKRIAWSRRGVLAAGSAATLLLAESGAAEAQDLPLGEPQPFSFERLIEEARGLAGQGFEPRPQVPPWLADVPMETVRKLKAKPERGVPLGATPFQLRPVHLGGFLREPVRIHLVEDGNARELLYDPAMFDTSALQAPEPLPKETGFAGFRVFYPQGEDGMLDELLTFLGASYFREVPKGGRYGTSARGLALETGLGRPEEFPAFTRFWLSRSGDRFAPLTIWALLESRSVVGAYRFDVAPREATLTQVDASLFFRADVQQGGIAPLTSMFFFGPSDRVGIDDYRERAHDASGLLMWRGTGEVVWRPIVNPAELRISVFGDENPRGFGLLQRDRSLGDFGDLDARYDLRPSLWVEPKGAWGKGSVRLIEIPTPDESHDNIVAFWTPEAPVKAGTELRLAYALTWTLAPPLQTGLASVVETRIGLGGAPGQDRPGELRKVAIDFGPGLEQTPGTPAPEVVLDCPDGVCTPPVLRPNPATGGWRVAFDARLPGGALELRCFLSQGGRPISETWLYRLDRT